MHGPVTASLEVAFLAAASIGRASIISLEASPSYGRAYGFQGDVCPASASVSAALARAWLDESSRSLQKPLV